jgi:hypothetical protein
MGKPNKPKDGGWLQELTKDVGRQRGFRIRLQQREEAFDAFKAQFGFPNSYRVISGGPDGLEYRWDELATDTIRLLGLQPASKEEHDDIGFFALEILRCYISAQKPVPGVVGDLIAKQIGSRTYARTRERKARNKRIEELDAQGLTSRQIAEEIDDNPGTVERVLSRPRPVATKRRRNNL